MTSYETGSFAEQHCLGNYHAKIAYEKSLPGSINNPISKAAIASNKWVALNDVNLGGFDVFSNCGKCVQVTAMYARKGEPTVKTTVGPLLVADACTACSDTSIDLKSAAYDDLGISRGSVQPQYNDAGNSKMETSWHFVSCNTPYKVVSE